MKVAFEINDPALFAGLVRWWTKSPYSHCELVFSDGAMFSSHLADHGTRYLGPRILSPNRWDILSIPMSADSEAMIRKWCDGELYCRYDWKGIFFSQLLRFQREHPEKWFCSEICTAALQHIGMLQGSPACTFSPGKLHKRLKETGAYTCAF